MAIDSTQDLAGKFSFVGMKQLMGYLSTFNCESQVVAIDGSNSENIQTTGTKLMMINGQPEVCEVDAELDISADTEGTETAWATATAYSTVGTIRKNRDGVRYRSTVAHTSSTSTEPGYGSSWDSYWEEAPHGAVNASGTSIAAGKDQWFLITAKADGTITLWKSGDAAATGTAICKVPQYDYKVYCPIGFLHIANGTASAFVVGTTGLDTASITDTYMNVVGPVFPHPDNWLKN